MVCCPSHEAEVCKVVLWNAQNKNEEWPRCRALLWHRKALLASKAFSLQLLLTSYYAVSCCLQAQILHGQVCMSGHEPVAGK